jgi:hypothetical protein
MRILFLTSPHEDYLADSLLLGFRQLFGAELVDYPKCDIMYEGCPAVMKSQVRGHGFTLYTGLLNEIEVDRSFIRPKLERGWFDLVVVSDLWRQFGFFTQWKPYLNPHNTILIDGADTPQVYPYAGYWMRRPYFWGLPRATQGFLYFKREWTENSRFDLWHRLLPLALRKRFPFYRGLRPISYSFPEEKIVSGTPVKTKQFARHLVDPEVAAQVPGSVTSYAFANEADYYADLQTARFSVTMKRAGWDCLRHYEIAANGCVPCFRNLDKKPVSCAPHDLIPGVNCLSYSNYGNLLSQISLITDTEYNKLQHDAMNWIRTKTTQMVVEHIMNEHGNFINR